MLEIEQLKADILALPEEAQQNIVDFVTLIKQQYQENLDSQKPSFSLDDQPFVGMWKDRPEMQNSSEWVRQIRKKQWQG